MRDSYNESGAEDRYVRDAWKRISDDYGDGITFSPEDFMLVVRYLVPTDHAIVPASSVPTEEQRAAVGRIVHYLTIQGDYWGSCHDIEAARAVAEGGK